MMIGPEPMIRIFLMSLRFGISKIRQGTALAAPAAAATFSLAECVELVIPSEAEGPAFLGYGGNQSAARSSQVGLLISMRLTFFWRDQPLICFSRAIAARMSRKDS